MCNMLAVIKQINFNHLRLAQTMADQLAKMQNLYDSLASQLSEATVSPESLPQSFGCMLGLTLEFEFHSWSKFTLPNLSVPII